MHALPMAVTVAQANTAGHTAVIPTAATPTAVVRMAVQKEQPLRLSSPPAKARVKKNGKSGGDYFGYDSLEEYYAAVYGEDWRDDETLTGVGADVDVDDDDDDNNPNSPFYVKEN